MTALEAPPAVDASGVRTPHDHVDRSRARRDSAAAASTATSASSRSSAASSRRRPPPRCSGCSSTRSSAGRTVFSMLADEMHENPMGTMHGGIVATLVDTAMGCAVSSTLPADAGFTTLELKTNYVRAITQATGRVYAEGRVVHAGGRVATTEARVHDDSGTLYAHATSTCLIMRGDTMMTEHDHDDA